MRQLACKGALALLDARPAGWLVPSAAGDTAGVDVATLSGHGA